MSVILGSDVARLVLGYLQDEELHTAAIEFCKTSSYLKEDYDWLQRGYSVCKISDLCLMDVIREHCEIKCAVNEYMDSLPQSERQTLKIQKTLSGKVNCIIGLLTNTFKPNSRKRPYSMISSTEATQSNDLPGYEPPLKERRLSQKLILRRDFTPKQNPAFSAALKQNVQDAYFHEDQVDENALADQVNNAEKSRLETSRYPIFTETILENTQFQNVLVDNINRILETSADRVDVSVENTNDSMNNNSLQEQVKHAIDNIILSTEQDPTFQQVLDDVVQHTAIQEQTIRATTSNDDATDTYEKVESPLPLKQRLRNRSQDKPRPNYNEIDQSTKKKPRKGKVEVISNEIVSSDIFHASTTVRENYVPLNQLLYLNSDRNATNFGQEVVYVNVDVPTCSQFRIDADTPMFLQNISLANSEGTTSLAPGSIISLPVIGQIESVPPIQSMVPNIIIKDIMEVNKDKQVERSIKISPSVSQTKRNLSVPKRQSHVRSLNFTSSEELANERLSNKKENVVKSEAVCDDVSSKSNEKPSLEEVDHQQDSSDAVDFSKEFDEATVISVELSPTETTKPLSLRVEKSNGSEKKKPQTRQQCQKDLDMWNRLRLMNKNEFDNYLRETVAVEANKAATGAKKGKKKKSKRPAKAKVLNVSAETAIAGKKLEKALESAQKTAPQESSSSECSNKTNDQEQLKCNESSASTERNDRNKPCSPTKRSAVRKRLIQIKLPASAKKKQNISQRNIAKIPEKQTEDTVETTTAQNTRIDPSEIVDIDLISPINHPNQEPNVVVVKSGVNLNNFLETPFKDDSSPFKFPITPGITVSSCTKTPGVRRLKDYDSLIKYSEYPTPSFAITPGRTKTPLSQSSSQKDGSSYNRATDYSSSSSYYKPDESDDVDKNIEVLIKENRDQTHTSSLGVEPHQIINTCNDQSISEEEVSDSSSSCSSSSDTSSSSSSSSNHSITLPDVDTKNDALPATTVKSVNTLNQLKLEEVRLRTMDMLKTDKKTERFRKPKTKTAIQRKNVIEMMAMMRKPLQGSKITGISTPKIAAKVLPKNVNKPNPKGNSTPSKRKIATPRRVIYLDYKEAARTNLRVSQDRKQAEQPTDKTTDALKIVQLSHSERPATTAETIDEIENHIAKTCESSSDTQIQELDNKVEVTDNTSKTQTVPSSSSARAILVRELFGDGTMSDSDFMDTPIKKKRIISSETVDVKKVSAKSETEHENLAAKTSDVSSVENFIADNTETNEPKNNERNVTKKDFVNDSSFTDTNSEKSEGKLINVEDSSVEQSIIKESTRADAPNSVVAHTNAKYSDDPAMGPTEHFPATKKYEKVQTQDETNDSQSESDDDDDDYDDCTLIPSLPISNSANRIYHSVVSDTQECVMKLISQSPDLRPLATFLNGRKILMETCDEVILFDSAPNINPTISKGMKSIPNKRKGVKIRRGEKTETTERKVPKMISHGKLTHDGTNNSGCEKNARFNIVAKHKRPQDASSQPSFSRDQRKVVSTLDEKQKSTGASTEVTTARVTKIPPLLKDMDINKVLGKIHPSKEIA
ncbi:hypothetical protein Bhyg_09892 [Pseudolycoriella hygida]|uniref:LisH domain-containing protein n=1 Tax=Pseudolycoriella hygida TaxID=35572 RepID=A0A9Q0MU89_9DIPT|nr:hypothetical protein Bhyg_09892 [Pseudolycoriella hygida]